MVLKEGYKHTDFGPVPPDWETERLGTIVSITSGESPSTIEFTADGSPYFKVEQLSSTEKYLNTFSTPYHFHNGKTVPLGSVIFAKRGAAISLNKIRILAQDSFMDTNLMALVPDERLDVEFLYYELSYTGLWRLADTTSVPQINNKHVKPILFPLPQKAEQRRIVSALSDVDVLLEGIERLVAKKRDLKQAAMQQLVPGRTRLPGFVGEWHQTTLGEIGECVIGLTYRPEDVANHGLLVLRSSNVQDGHLAYDDNVYVNIDVPGRLYTRCGDILVCVRNGSRALIGKCALISEATVPVTFGAFMSVFRTKYWRFIFHAFQAESIQRQIRDNIGATINQITNKDMAALRVTLPPEDEQLAISTVLNDMDAEISALEQRLSKTRELKQAMMQALLTGRTRLIATEVAYA